jgi:hypothetical protein
MTPREAGVQEFRSSGVQEFRMQIPVTRTDTGAESTAGRVEIFFAWTHRAVPFCNS